jgi:coenzyme F420-reducing hydrogenase delta subunit
LERRGFGNQRVNQYWLSSAESEKLVKSVEDTLEKIRKIGPNPLNLQQIKVVKKGKIH